MMRPRRIKASVCATARANLGSSASIARERLDRALEWFHEIGAEVYGAVGDTRPLLAIGDALRDQPFDQIIPSTLSAGVSRWLRMDLPSRSGRSTCPFPTSSRHPRRPDPVRDRIPSLTGVAWKVSTAPASTGREKELA